VLADLSLVESFDMLVDFLNVTCKFLLVFGVVKLKEHFLNDVLQILFVWKVGLWCKGKDLSEDWVLFEVDLHLLGRRETIASEEIVDQSDGDLWLVVSILVFIWELNMKFLSECLIWMSLNAQGRPYRQYFEQKCQRCGEFWVLWYESLQVLLT
jgi:hypothetical protein